MNEIINKFREKILSLINGPKDQLNYDFDVDIYNDNIKESDFRYAIYNPAFDLVTFAFEPENVIYTSYEPVVVILIELLKLPDNFFMNLIERKYSDDPVEFHSRDLECGTMMTIKDFKQHLKHKSIISYDGFGYYGTSNKESNISVDFSPKRVDKTLEHYKDYKFTHVYWYNR